MTITDELRKWVHEHVVYGMQTTLEPPTHPLTFGTKEEVLSIADRIDEEHEIQLADAFDTCNSDENLEANGWVRLPFDADGMPIRIGDVMVNATSDGYVFLPAEVVGYHRCCDTVYPIVENDGEYQVEPKEVRHRCKHTTEDVLWELCNKFLLTGCNKEVIAEYAKRMQLKEE